MAKRLQEKPRKQRSLRGMARRGLSILMAMVMVISLIQISVFADSQYEIGAQITLDSDDSSKLPTNIPDNAYWDGPEVTPAYITGEPICGKVEHTHITETSCAHLPHTDACYEDVWVPCTPEANPDHYDDIFGNPVHKLGQGDYDWKKVDFGTWKEELVCSHQCSAEAGCVTKDMLCEDPCPVVEHTHNTDPNDSEGCCYEVVPAQYTWTLTEKGTMDNGMVVTGADVNVEEYHFLNSALAEMKAEAEANDPKLTHRGVTFTELKVEFQDGYEVNAGPIIGMWRATVQGITDHRQPENISGVTLYYYNWLKVQRYSYTFTPDRLRAILYEAPELQALDYAEVFLKDATSTSTYYTVTFNYGYEFEEGITTSYEYVKEGETVAEITPTRSGYSFDGWYLNDEKYNFNTPVTGDITLTAKWTESTDPDPVTEVTNFYISLDGTVRDYVDENDNKVVAGHDTSYFSGSVYTGEMTATSHDYTLVGKVNAAADTDKQIRALTTLKDVPKDADVFAALQKDEKMQAYCNANEMDISTITSENYSIYWYVVKYENDGWHVDGVLVEKGEEPNYPVEYTVVHEYYTDGKETYETSQTLSGYVGDEINAAELEKKVTDDQGNTYTYASASPNSITLTDNATANVITLRYERTTDDGNPGGTTYYTLTVKYLEEDSNEELAPAYTQSIAAGRSYDVTAQTQKTIDGYDISKVTGDDVSGFMSGNREIIVYYTVYIDDGETPLDPGPGGDGSGDGDTDIGDGEVPLDPGTGNNGDGTDIGDENVPLVPATGDNLTLWVLAAVASAAGLVYLTVTGKKREQKKG